MRSNTNAQVQKCIIKAKEKELIFPTLPSAFSQLTPVHLKEFLKGAPGKFATSWS